MKELVYLDSSKLTSRLTWVMNNSFHFKKKLDIDCSFQTQEKSLR